MVFTACYRWPQPSQSLPGSGAHSPRSWGAARCLQLHPFPENFLQKQKPPSLRGYIIHQPCNPKRKTHTGASLRHWLTGSKEKACPCLRGPLPAAELPRDQTGQDSSCQLLFDGLHPAPSRCVSESFPSINRMQNYPHLRPYFKEPEPRQPEQ